MMIESIMVSQREENQVIKFPRRIIAFRRFMKKSFPKRHMKLLRRLRKWVDWQALHSVAVPPPPPREATLFFIFSSKHRANPP